jgi:hypothetical protein
VGVDTINIVSCISCKSCVEEFFDSNKITKNNILIFDDDCESDFTPYLKKFKHYNVNQDSLDYYFDNFGDIITLVKKRGNYVKTIN